MLKLKVLSPRLFEGTCLECEEPILFGTSDQMHVAIEMHSDGELTLEGIVCSACAGLSAGKYHLATLAGVLIMPDQGPQPPVAVALRSEAEWAKEINTQIVRKFGTMQQELALCAERIPRYSKQSLRQYVDHWTGLLQETEVETSEDIQRMLLRPECEDARETLLMLRSDLRKAIAEGEARLKTMT